MISRLLHEQNLTKTAELLASSRRLRDLKKAAGLTLDPPDPETGLRVAPPKGLGSKPKQYGRVNTASVPPARGVSGEIKTAPPPQN